MPIRLFIALDLPEDIRENMRQFIGECKNIQRDGLKYVDAENLHITLKFIGDTDEDKIPPLINELQKVGKQKRELDISRTGAFPAIQYPKVIFIGLNKSEQLLTEVNEIEAACERCGIARETREFLSHITICRVKESIDEQLKNFLLTQRDRKFGAFCSEGFHLYQSELKPGGPKYTKLRSL